VKKEKWWPGTELNRRHIDFQSTALPTELPGHLPHTTIRSRAASGKTKARYLIVNCD
jgi:hypothetical protein